MEDLSDLYQEIILAHNKRPRNGEPLIPCTHQAEGFNPLCGDKLTVYIRKPDEQVNEIACKTEGCAISSASGSIMTTMIQGKTITEIEKLIEETKALLTGDEEPEIDLVQHGEMAALVGVRKFPARVKCATLAWHALESALKGEVEATTE
ncbi:MAG: SUF system NifU family Fe-S cluster assembly protein [Verrucomicrobiales bacterium]|jgi:nitrogen fixation NifU-like protein|nr:SUF system NifU family Fe-S cluster assembly protein [Verrucomicrobiales bacterium]MEC7357719.1 SUF system NifU family Fe-S cluster assembly protein [Verrucomicrobiota bacterium]